MTWVAVGFDGRRRWDATALREWDYREAPDSAGPTITFNPIMQHREGFDLEAVPTPVEEGATNGTDPWGITDGALGG